jgi:hypothetical protein
LIRSNPLVPVNLSALGLPFLSPSINAIVAPPQCPSHNQAGVGAEIRPGKPPAPSLAPASAMQEDAGMDRGRLVLKLCALWVVAVAATLWIAAAAVPSGDGFHRGMDRAVALLSGVAAVFAVALAASVAAAPVVPRGGIVRRAGRALPWITLAGAALALALRVATMGRPA